MKFRRFNASAPISPGAEAPRGYPLVRAPDWRKEWLANRPQYVLLSCGCFEDLKYGAILIIAVFGIARYKTVFCERCNDWAKVERSATSHEYQKLPPITIPEVPLF